MHYRIMYLGLLSMLLLPVQAKAQELCWTLGPFIDTVQVAVTPHALGYGLQVVWRGANAYQLLGPGTAAGAFPDAPGQVDMAITLLNPSEFFGGNRLCTLSARLSLATLGGPWQTECIGAMLDNSGTPVLRPPFLVSGTMAPTDCASIQSVERLRETVQGQMVLAGE